MCKRGQVMRSVSEERPTAGGAGARSPVVVTALYRLRRDSLPGRGCHPRHRGGGRRCSGQFSPAHDIVVRGTTHRSLRAGGPVRFRAAKTTIDGRGKVAVPGAHRRRVCASRRSRRERAGSLAQGVTAVLDAGTDPARLGRWRETDSGRHLRAAHRRRCARSAGERAPAPAGRARAFRRRRPPRVSSRAARPMRRSAQSRWDRARALLPRTASARSPRAARPIRRALRQPARGHPPPERHRRRGVPWRGADLRAREDAGARRAAAAHAVAIAVAAAGRRRAL